MHYLAWRYDTTVVPLPANMLVGGLAFFNAIHYLGSSIRSDERFKSSKLAGTGTAASAAPPKLPPNPAEASSTGPTFS